MSKNLQLQHSLNSPTAIILSVSLYLGPKILGYHWKVVVERQVPRVTPVVTVTYHLQLFAEYRARPVFRVFLAVGVQNMHVAHGL